MSHIHTTHRSYRRSSTAAVAWLVALGSLATLTSACTTGNDDAASNEAFVVPHLYDLALDPAAAISEISGERGVVVPAEQLRALLEQGLLWHGITLVQVMRSARVNDSEVSAWIDQLSQNTLDLTSAIGLVYGPAGARAFNQQWAQHTQFLVDYAVAIGVDDDKAAAQAVIALTNYSEDSGSYFETATGGVLPADAVRELLATHIQHMTEMLVADAAGNLASAVDLAITDSAHLASIGNTLSVAIAGQQPVAFPGSTDTPAAAFCTIVTTGTSAFLISRLMTNDPASRQSVETSAALSGAVGGDAEVYLGLDQQPLVGGAASVAAAARLALDTAASKSAAPVAAEPAVAGPVAGEPVTTGS